MKTSSQVIRSRIATRRRQYAFASLLTIFNRPGLASVDLVDSFPRRAMRAPAESARAPTVNAMPDSGRPEHTQFMPWRLD